MTYIGYIAAIIIFASLWAVFATGRRCWLVTVFWAGIMLVMSLGAKRGVPMNGLCLSIAVFETIMSIRALYGVIMWDHSFKDKGVVIPIVIYLITLVLVSYCVRELQKLGYVPDIMNVKEGATTAGNILAAIVLMIISILPAYVGLLRFERFFSNPSELTLLDCRFYTSALSNGKAFKTYSMNGINNGVKHYLRVTKRTYFMLRFENRLQMNVYKDLRGNIFVTENPCPKNLENVARRDLKTARNIAMSAVVYLVLMFIVL